MLTPHCPNATPSGYPELHAATLAVNRAMREALHEHVATGKPLLAECGGMMACFSALQDINGQAHAMFGLLPGVTRMQEKLAGHTFHYSTAATALEPVAQAIKTTGKGGEAIYRSGRLTASYMHCYFPSNPEATARLLLP